jgi:hypothetical protein
MLEVKDCHNCGWMTEIPEFREGCEDCTRQPPQTRERDNWKSILPYDHDHLSWEKADKRDQEGWDVRRPGWKSSIASWCRGPDGRGWSVEDLRARDYFVVGKRR